MYVAPLLAVNQIIPESTVDGPGLRTAIFFQGCEHHCQGCHNPETWPREREDTKFYTANSLALRIQQELLTKKVTFTGGDPLYQWPEIYRLMRILKDGSPDYTFGCYTGFTVEEIINDTVTHKLIAPDFRKCMSMFEWVVTDPFVEEQRTMEKPFRGSANQRVVQFELIYGIAGTLLKAHDLTEKWDRGEF